MKDDSKQAKYREASQTFPRRSSTKPMMSGAGATSSVVEEIQSTAILLEHSPSLPVSKNDLSKEHWTQTIDEQVSVRAAQNDVNDHQVPTEEEMVTLRRVSAPIPFVGLAICLVELAERASYYGSSGPFNNFINNPLPAGGNGAGAVAKGPAGKDQSAGALGLGSVDASAITNLFKFMSYVTPILGGIIADTKWGRFKSIAMGTAVGAIAHVILVVPAIPSVIQNAKGSLGSFIISVVILSFAAGFIKSSLAPLLCDQIPVKGPTIKYTKSGEKVIVDPQVTIQRYLLIFYQCINVGAFFAVATEYVERFVGFWLAYLLPGILYMIMPPVLIYASSRLYKAPPQGSVLIEAAKVCKVLFTNGGWRKRGEEFWNSAKPSHVAARDGTVDVNTIFWDDKFVDEIRQALNACAVFLLIPIFALCDGGIGNAMNDMSVAMELNGVPNDLIQNFNALAVITGAPMLAFVLYPFLAKIGHPLSPMSRMSIGFILASFSSTIAAILQWRVYTTSPCGYYATTCDTVSPVSVLWQIPVYYLAAIGELFVNVTSYELAYTRAPARMKGLVYAMSLFNLALSAAISLGLSPIIKDPYLIWSWVALAILAFLIAFLFPTYFRHLNDTVEGFADKDRQAGLQQPKVLSQNGGSRG